MTPTDRKQAGSRASVNYGALVMTSVMLFLLIV